MDLYTFDAPIVSSGSGAIADHAYPGEPHLPVGRDGLAAAIQELAVGDAKIESLSANMNEPNEPLVGITAGEPAPYLSEPSERCSVERHLCAN